ncbi:YtxH domain-containing protein [Cohnella massiliensis]|uniref:YtxH domain-containing protein n=1 Tax=Cohnella massiliensis TaxID=1816691 RepID=UPI001119DF54|nr:YtxH domain-containing protein [Cohnella massiliensis]
MANKKNVKSFVWGTVAGAVTGAVAALLLAPKPGRELRKDIADKAQVTLDKTVDLGRQAGATAQSIAKKTTGIASNLRSKFGKKEDGTEIASVAAVSSADSADSSDSEESAAH